MKKIATFLVLLFISFNIISTFAKPSRPMTITRLEELINPIAQILYYGGLFIGIGYIVYSGYALMVSEGNPDRVKDAQSQLTAAIVGTAFILLSAAIFRVIIHSFFGDSSITL